MEAAATARYVPRCLFGAKEAVIAAEEALYGHLQRHRARAVFDETMGTIS
jgi:hypothetical protein